MRGDLLRFSDPRWVAQLAGGATWLIRGINGMLASLILAIVVFLATAVLRATLGPAWQSSHRWTVPLLGLLAVLGALAAGLGLWRLTNPEPARLDDEPRWSGRRLARLCLPALLGCVALSSTASWRIALVGEILEVGAFVLAALAMLALRAYLAGLAIRLPDPALAARTRLALRNLAILLILHLAFAMLNGLLIPPPTNPLMTGAGSCFGLLIFLMLLVYLNRTLRLLMDYRTHLRQAAEQARANWNNTRTATP